MYDISYYTYVFKKRIFVLLFCSVGCVFCDPKEPVKVCTRFRARILIFNIEIPVTKGFPVSLSESYFHCELLRAFPFHMLSHVSNLRSHLVSRSVSLPPKETDSAATWRGCKMLLWLLVHLADVSCLAGPFRRMCSSMESGWAVLLKVCTLLGI